MSSARHYTAQLLDSGAIIHMVAAGGGRARLLATSRCGLAALPGDLGQLLMAAEESWGHVDQALGARLFAALFKDQVGIDLCESLRDLADRPEDGIVVTIAPEGGPLPALMALPWELMRPAGLSDDALGGLARLSVTRRVAERDARPAPAERLRVLLVAEGALGESLVDALSKANLEAVALDVQQGMSLDSLLASARQLRPHVIHIVGAGRLCLRATGDLSAEIALGHPDAPIWLTEDAVGALAGDAAVVLLQAAAPTSHPAALVWLAAGLAGGQTAAAAALQFTLSPQDTTAFASGFYQSLSASSTVADALGSGRARLLRNGDTPGAGHAIACCLGAAPGPVVAPATAAASAPTEPAVAGGAAPGEAAQTITPADAPARVPWAVAWPERPAVALPLERLLDRLSPDGRRALEIAVGEAVRVGRWWIGLEMLVMALTRLPGALDKALFEFMISPMSLRGVYRSAIGIATSESWAQQNVVEIGAGSLAHIEAADPARLSPPAVGDRRILMTPRLLAVLRDAAALAQTGPISPDQLLWAILKQHGSLAAELLATGARSVLREPAELIERLEQLIDPCDPAVAPPADQPLDLTALARAGLVGRVHGRTARWGIAQIAQALQRPDPPHLLIQGAPGSGRRAVIEGLARLLARQREAAGAALADLRLLVLDIPDNPAAAVARVQQALAAADRPTAVILEDPERLYGPHAPAELRPAAALLGSALDAGRVRCLALTASADLARGGLPGGPTSWATVCLPPLPLDEVAAIIGKKLAARAAGAGGAPAAPEIERAIAAALIAQRAPLAGAIAALRGQTPPAPWPDPARITERLGALGVDGATARALGRLLGRGQCGVQAPRAVIARVGTLASSSDLARQIALSCAPDTAPAPPVAVVEPGSLAGRSAYAALQDAICQAPAGVIVLHDLSAITGGAALAAQLVSTGRLISPQGALADARYAVLILSAATHDGPLGDAGALDLADLWLPPAAA